MSNPISSIAYDEASAKIGKGQYSFSKILDKDGHSFHYYYQASVLNNLLETDIIMGIIASYDRDSCNAAHWASFEDHLRTDECRMFRHPDRFGGGSDHFNMRWFKEWCEANNPRLLKIYGLKTFW